MKTFLICHEEEALRNLGRACSWLSSGGFYSRTADKEAVSAGTRKLFNFEPTTRIGTVNGCMIRGRFSVQQGMSIPAFRRNCFGWLVTRLAGFFPATEKTGEVLLAKFG